MTSNSSQPDGSVAVTDALNDKVLALIVVLTGNKELFSAYDVTMKLRTDPANKGMNIPHRDVRDMVLAEFRNSFCDDYARTLTELTSGDETFIYHPDSVKNTDYHLAVSDTDDTDTDDTDADDDTDATASSNATDLTVEKKLNIPREVLDKLGLSAGKKVQVESNNDSIFITEVDSSPHKTMFVAADGRLRLCQSTLTGAFGRLPDRYDITVSNSTIQVKARP